MNTQTASISLQSEAAVERRPAASLSYAEFLQKYVVPNRPVVVEGAVQKWPALQKWTPTFFKSRFGSTLVDISHRNKMAFAEFIDAVEASSEAAPGPYMYRLFIGPHLPDLLPDVTPQNEYAFPRRLANRLMPRQWRRPDGYLKLLIGGVGGKFPVMHFDGENMHAAITEIYGDKEFIMYPPEDSPYMYPKEKIPNQSDISDIAHPDLEKFPLLAKATRYRTVLRPGEMIFVPSHWWHTARVLSTSISVCQNILDASRWNGFVAEVCPPASGLRAVKMAFKRAHLTAAGLAVSASEGLSSGCLGRSGALGRRLSRFAPLEASKAMEPTQWPVKNWVVR